MRWPWQKRNLPPGALLTHPGGSAQPTWALSTDSPFGRGGVDTDAAMRCSAVWACVRLVADTVSTLPLDAYRADEAITTPPLLREPAAGQPFHEWVYSVLVSLLLRGNAYGLITARSGATLLPAQVELVHPDLVSVHQEPDTGEITYHVGGKPFARDDVWHVRAFTMPGVSLGLSPVEYARQAIGLGLAAEKFGGEFFGKGATPTGLITTERDLDAESTRTLAERWKGIHQGRHGVAFLSGAAKYEQIQVAPEESQFLDTQRFTVAQVARVFGVPAEMIGGDPGHSLTYSNTEHRSLDFLRYSLNPWLVRLESSLGRLLPRQQSVKFNTGSLLRPTTKERYEAHKLALDAGFLTVNEVRALEDLPPLDEEPRPDSGGAVAL